MILSILKIKFLKSFFENFNFVNFSF